MSEQARDVRIAIGDANIAGRLSMASPSLGLVLFAHGSGSSRFSPRNQFVARVLNTKGFATLLMDLLTPSEESLDEQTGELRFNIPFLAQRLIQVTDWAQSDISLASLPVGYFGASTGAAAALVAAAQRTSTIRAIVSRGGRPDLAGASLSDVRAPTLLIVGSRDVEVLALNESAAARLRAPCQLAVVHGATHLFEEPGALEEVARLATAWFAQHLTAPVRPFAQRPVRPAPTTR